MDFKSLMENIKQNINGLMNGDSPKEVIDAIGKVNEDLDKASQEYEDKTNRLHDMTEAYIKAKKLEGSDEQPKEETHIENKPKSLEEIAQEIVNKEQK